MATRKNSLTLARHTPAPVRSSQELVQEYREAKPAIYTLSSSKPATGSDRALEKDYGNGQPLSFHTAVFALM
jgi:hypothetical protein